MPAPQPPQPAPPAAADPFAGLADAAAAVEGAAAPPADPTPAGGQVEDPTARDANEILIQLKLARSLARGRFAWWPEFGEVWSNDTLGAIAATGAEVMAMHGMSLSQLMGRWGPYIALAFAVGTPSFVTWEAIQQRRDAIDAHRRRAAQPPAPQPAPPPS